MRLSLLFFVILLLGLYILISGCMKLLERKIKIRNHIFTVEIPSTIIQKQKGLGYRDSLPPDHGMLFIYDYRNKFTFWMKGMRFPLDFIWIENDTIVDITKNVPVEKSRTFKKYSPRVPVNKILELNAGTVDRLGIEIGDTIEFIEQ